MALSDFHHLKFLFSTVEMKEVFVQNGHEWYFTKSPMFPSYHIYAPNDHSKEVSCKLNKWFFDHRNNPYPSGTEKSKLCKSTDLDKQQICNWFSNKRRFHKNRQWSDRHDKSNNQFDPCLVECYLCHRLNVVRFLNAFH